MFSMHLQVCMLVCVCVFMTWVLHVLGEQDREVGGASLRACWTDQDL